MWDSTQQMKHNQRYNEAFITKAFKLHAITNKFNACKKVEQAVRGEWKCMSMTILDAGTETAGQNELGKDARFCT